MTLFDFCQTIDPAILHEAVRQAHGAAYLVSPGRLAANVTTLRNALRAQYANSDVSYSYKTNYLAAFVETARREGALSEVVSLTEYELARSYGVADEEIIVNGPGKNAAALEVLVRRPLTLIADSINELERLARLAQGGEVRAQIGIRLTPRLSFQKGPSRFGIDLNDSSQRKTLRGLAERGVCIRGIHLHLTDNRSVESYLERLNYLLDCWSQLDLGEPEFVDIGGGFASAMPEQIRRQLLYPIDTLDTYGRVLGAHMKSLFPDERVRFICEPGTGLLADTVVFVTPVLDVKQIDGASLAVVDGSYFCINPLRSQTTPAVFVASGLSSTRETERVKAPVAVYGNSCMDTDLHLKALNRPLSIGDLLVFAQKGAYAACMAAPFIHGIPAVIGLGDNVELSILRARTDASLLSYLNQ